MKRIKVEAGVVVGRILQAGREEMIWKKETKQFCMF